MDEDFTGTSYFSNRTIFATDGGEIPTNQLNVSLPLIIDDIIAEDWESFVLIIELRPLCETGALVDVQQRSSLVHIIDNDGEFCKKKKRHSSLCVIICTHFLSHQIFTSNEHILIL